MHANGAVRRFRGIRKRLVIRFRVESGSIPFSSIKLIKIEHLREQFGGVYKAIGAPCSIGLSSFMIHRRLLGAKQMMGQTMIALYYKLARARCWRYSKVVREGSRAKHQSPCRNQDIHGIRLDYIRWTATDATEPGIIPKAVHIHSILAMFLVISVRKSIA